MARYDPYNDDCAGYGHGNDRVEVTVWGRTFWVCPGCAQAKFGISPGSQPIIRV